MVLLAKPSNPIDSYQIAIDGVDDDGFNDTLVDTHCDPIRVGLIYTNMTAPKPTVPADSPFATIRKQIDTDISFAKGRTGSFLSETLSAEFYAGGPDAGVPGSYLNTIPEEDFDLIFNDKDAKIDAEADEIRNYYRNKFTMMKLTDIPLNPFQQTLHEYVFRDHQGQFKYKEIGLISSIVHAYSNDIELDRVCSLCNKDIASLSDWIAFDHKPVKVIGGCLPFSDRYAYRLFLSDLDNSFVVSAYIRTGEATPLFMDTVFNNHDDLKLNMNAILKCHNDQFFYAGQTQLVLQKGLKWI